MFVSPPDQAVAPDEGPARDPAPPLRRRPADPLALLAERTRPVSSSRTRLLPVLPPLRDLLPDGGLRRGSTLVVTDLTGRGPDLHAGGGVALALALCAAASGAGSWCAFVGLTGFGAVAARDLGVDLERAAVVPRPGVAWAEVTAVLLDGVDLVVLCPPFPPRPAMVRRLVARVRRHRSVLLVVAGRAGWPEHPDVRLGVRELCWDGAGDGAGHLRRRRMAVVTTARHAATRAGCHRLWLPSADGTVAG